jgi:hypothetical protein
MPTLTVLGIVGCPRYRPILYTGRVRNWLYLYLPDWSSLHLQITCHFYVFLAYFSDSLVELSPS